MSNDVAKLESVLKAIASIEGIVARHGGISRALEDEMEGRPALLMWLMQIGEILHKIKNPEILACFDERDVKGAYDVRNFITHDYEGVNLLFVESIIREKMGELREKCNLLLTKLNG